MMTLREKAIAIAIVLLLNFAVLVFAWWFLLFSIPISVLFVVGILRR